jgi:hypothetical protein
LEKAMVIPIYKGDDRLLVTNYRPVCKQMEHFVTASYLRKIWDKGIGYFRSNVDSGWYIHAKVK